MSKIINFKLIILLLISFKIFLFDIEYIKAHEVKPPEAAVKFAEEEFLHIVEEVVFTDVPSEWGFKDNIGTITFSDLFPIYSLNVDFAFGDSDQITLNKEPKWVAVIFQDDQPVNAIGTFQTSDGIYQLDAVGYAPELPNGLLNLTKDQVVIYDFSAEEYYLYSDTENTVVKVEQLTQRNRINQSQSKSQFQNMLMERFESMSESEQDSSGGFPDTFTNDSSFHLDRFIYPIALILMIVGSYFFLHRRFKLKK